MKQKWLKPLLACLLLCSLAFPAAAANKTFLLHGWNGNPSTFDNLKRLMTSDGGWQTSEISLGDYSSVPESYTIEQVAYEVADDMALARTSNDSNPIDVVCHSMGGLVVRTILAHKDSNYNGDHSSYHLDKTWVRRFITLATPHYGHWLNPWDWIPFGSDIQRHEMYMGGSFLWDLALDWQDTSKSLPSANVLCVVGRPDNGAWWSAYDESDGVVPYWSAALSDCTARYVDRLHSDFWQHPIAECRGADNTPNTSDDVQDPVYRLVKNFLSSGTVLSQSDCGITTPYLPEGSIFLRVLTDESNGVPYNGNVVNYVTPSQTLDRKHGQGQWLNCAGLELLRRIPVNTYSITFNTSSGSTVPTFTISDVPATGGRTTIKEVYSGSDPTITSVSPGTLPASSSPQQITIYGSHFLPSSDPNASTLVFYDPANNAYTRTPTYVNSGELRYNITVQSASGTWKVKVVNGTVSSTLCTFTVTSVASTLTGLSISGPATIAENNTAQFTATALYSDGSSQNVSPTWSENSSATSISSSGLLSAGNVSANAIITVSASYTVSGVSKTASTDITVVDSGSGGSPQTTECLVNTNFEAGTATWTVGGNAAIVNLSYPHGGNWYAYIGNANNAVGSFAQFFPIPASATAATLKFYIDIVTSETTTSTKYDKLNVDLCTENDEYVATIAEFSNIDKGDNINGTYVLKTYDIMSLLNAYKGQSLFLIFSGTTDSGLPTIFRIDDVSLRITTPAPINLTGLSISGPSSIREQNGNTYYAMAIFSDGTTQTVSPNSWSENSPATTISVDGFLSADQVGANTPVTVTASYTFNGTTQQASKNVTIIDTNSPVTFNTLSISGPTTVGENSTRQFTATAIFSDGSSQTVSPSWSENSTATTISGSGLLTVGTLSSDVTITVGATHTIGSVTRSGNQDVLLINTPEPPSLTSLSISGTQSLNENSTAQYTATATFSDSSSLEVNPTWSEDSDATSISSFGLLSADETSSDTPLTISASYTVDGVTRQATYAVTVCNLNKTPSDIGLSNSTLPENQPSETVVGTLSTTDPDTGNTFTYTLVSGAGNTNNTSFTINGNTLRTATSFNYEVKSIYSARIRTTDQGGLWHEKAFTILVTDVDEKPVIVGLDMANGTNAVFRWSSITNHKYTVHCSTNLLSGFSVQCSNLIATPPMNCYTDSIYNCRQKFWYLTTEE